MSCSLFINESFPWFVKISKTPYSTRREVKTKQDFISVVMDVIQNKSIDTRIDIDTRECLYTGSASWYLQKWLEDKFNK